MDPQTIALQNQLSALASGLNAAMQRGDTAGATAIQQSINATQTQLAGTAPTSSAPAFSLSNIPWWVWLGLAAGAYYYFGGKKKGKKRK